jgi:hypothetical protein
LTWHLWTCLEALGRFTPLSRDEAGLSVIANMSMNYASQLEFSNEIEYAVYVLLSTPASPWRTAAVKELVCRHIPSFSAHQELRLVQLGVPSQWIHEAKLWYSWHYASAQPATTFQKQSGAKLYEGQVMTALRAGLLDSAHFIVVNKWAPRIIISQEATAALETVLTFLEHANKDRLLRDWPNGGQLFLEYLQKSEQIKTALSSKNLSALKSLRESFEQLAQRLSRWTSDLSQASQKSAVPFRHRNWESDLALERVCAAKMASAVIKHIHSASGDHVLDPKQQGSRSLDEAVRLAGLAIPDENRSDALQTLTQDYLRWRVRV